MSRISAGTGTMPAGSVHEGRMAAAISSSMQALRLLYPEGMTEEVADGARRAVSIAYKERSGLPLTPGETEEEERVLRSFLARPKRRNSLRCLFF